MIRQERQSLVFDLRSQGIGWEGIQEFLSTQYDMHYSIPTIKRLYTEAEYKERHGLWQKPTPSEITNLVRGV